MERTKFLHDLMQISTLFIGSLCITTWMTFLPVFGLTVHDESNSNQEIGTRDTDVTEMLSDEKAQLKGNRGW